MKSIFSLKVRSTVMGNREIPDEVKNILEEAADTLEEHESMVYRLLDKLKAADIRYSNLYTSRQQLLKDARLGILLSSIITGTIVALGFYLYYNGFHL